MNLRVLALGALTALLLLGGSYAPTLAAPAKVCKVPSTKFPTVTAALSKRKCTTINVAAGTFQETDLYVSRNVTITGAGASQTILDAGGERGFYISFPTEQFNLSGVTLVNAAQDPGALMLDTDVTAIVSDSVFKNNNRAIWIDGGTLTLSGVTIRDNFTPNHSAAIFREFSPGPLTIANSKFIKNRAPCGGAIYSATENEALLVITNSIFKKNNNEGIECSGGAIYTEDPTQITDSRFLRNSNDRAGGAGGAIHQNGSALAIQDSTFSRNRAAIGGAIHAESGTELRIDSSTFDHNSTFLGNGGGVSSKIPTTILNSTFSANAAEPSVGAGGGVSLFGAVTHNLIHVTFSGNSASSGGSLLLSGTTAKIKNSLLNSGAPNNCLVGGSVLTSLGSNLSSDASCAAHLNQPGDDNSTNLLLDVLAKNGGPTKTHALLDDSPALDGVIECKDHLGGDVTSDQRGVARPQGEACDSGAYEAE